MFCEGCGAKVANSALACSACGSPTEIGEPATIDHAGSVAAYATMARKLGLWFLLFALFNAISGVGGVMVGAAGNGRGAGLWEPWPHTPLLNWTYMGAAAWILLAVRVPMAVAAGAALQVQAPGGRRLGVFAAAAALTEFPVGVLFGSYALLRLMGKRNAALYSSFTEGVRKPRATPRSAV